MHLGHPHSFQLYVKDTCNLLFLWNAGQKRTWKQATVMDCKFQESAIGFLDFDNCGIKPNCIMPKRKAPDALRSDIIPDYISTVTFRRQSEVLVGWPVVAELFGCGFFSSVIILGKRCKIDFIGQLVRLGFDKNILRGGKRNPGHLKVAVWIRCRTGFYSR